MVLSSLLLQLSRAIGLCNLRYVPKKGRFERDNGPMLFYWIVLHLVYLLIIPCVFVVMVRSFFNCQEIEMLAVAFTVISVAKVGSLVLLISSLWLFRGRWLRMGNRFLAMQQLYRCDLAKRSLRRRLRKLWKVILCLSKILLILLTLYGPKSLPECNESDDNKPQMSVLYIVLTMALLPLEMFINSIDYWIYHIVNVSNWLVDCLTLEAQGLRQDLNWLPQRRGGHRNVYQQQLFNGWQQLWQRCMRLDKLHREMITIFQWQMLLNILTHYLIDVTSLFYVVIYLNEPENFNDWYFLGYWITCVLFHLDIMSCFTIFGLNRLKWKQLQQEVHEIYLTLHAMDFDWQEDVYCVALHRKIEFTIILINRRLQWHPNRVRRLQIAGLFDLNRRSEFCMSTSIAANVLLMWQIAYQNYY